MSSYRVTSVHKGRDRDRGTFETMSEALGEVAHLVMGTGLADEEDVRFFAGFLASRPFGTTVDFRGGYAFRIDREV